MEVVELKSINSIEDGVINEDYEEEEEEEEEENENSNVVNID